VKVFKDSWYLPHEKEIQELSSAIQRLQQEGESNPSLHAEIDRLEKKLEDVRAKVYGSLTPWDRVLISRHPKRPHAQDYIREMCSSFFELHGDRTYGDDRSMIGGLASIGDQSLVILGQEKGSTTEERVACNFGMVSPEGFRKALRLMQLAEKMNIPVVTLLDTPGAYPGLEAEQRGQGWVIAENLQKMFSVKTPIIVIIIGEGCSGGALGMGVGDSIAILEHAYYSVISPEGCASILWKDAGKKQEAASALKLNAEHMLALRIVDDVLKEPLGGAHYDPAFMFNSVKEHILRKIDLLRKKPLNALLEERYQKFRSITSVTEGQAP
jgi:acetyl-CoA carboxylase carboxyl transferase subunit alpha